MHRMHRPGPAGTPGARGELSRLLALLVLGVVRGVIAGGAEREGPISAGHGGGRRGGGGLWGCWVWVGGGARARVDPMKMLPQLIHLAKLLLGSSGILAGIRHFLSCPRIPR